MTAPPPLVLAAKVAPQRSTQYAALASALAEPELRLSPLAPSITDLRRATLAGQPYLLLDLVEPLTEEQERALWQAGATSEFFWFHEAVSGVPGPFLQPLTPRDGPLLPSELVEARRYRGKTNELFSRVLVNLARWAHADDPREKGKTQRAAAAVTLLDPLMGGGTFLFIALGLGLDALGIEQQRGDVESTDTFLEGFLKEERIRFQRKQERVTGGRRTLYTLQPEGSPRPLRATLIHGDTVDAPRLLTGLPGTPRPDLIVADLPYGIQHVGQLESLLRQALPAWTAVSAPDAVLALAWDATRTSREQVTSWVEADGAWAVLRGGAWETLAHPVDRVIKRRDVLVARRREWI